MKKYISVLAIACVFLVGCGGEERPGDSLIEWKTPGTGNLNNLTSTGVMYTLDWASYDRFEIKRISANGNVEWTKRFYSILDSEAKFSETQLYVHEGQNGNDRIVVTGYQSMVNDNQDTNLHHVLVLDQSGKLLNEIEEDSVASHRYKASYAGNGLFFRIKDANLDFIWTDAERRVDFSELQNLPSGSGFYSIKDVKVLDVGVFVRIQHLGQASLPSKLAFLNFDGDVLWIEDSPVDDVGGNAVVDGNLFRAQSFEPCGYNIYSIAAAEFRYESFAPCDYENTYPSRVNRYINGSLHEAISPSGTLKYIRTNGVTGQREVTYEKVVYVSEPEDQIGLYASVTSVNSDNTVTLTYKVSENIPDPTPDNYIFDHDRYWTGVVILNGDGSLKQEIEFPEYHIYVFWLDCFGILSACVNDVNPDDERSGYEILNARTVNGKTYASLLYRSFNSVSGYTREYYHAVLK